MFATQKAASGIEMTQKINTRSNQKKITNSSNESAASSPRLNNTPISKGIALSVSTALSVQDLTAELSKHTDIITTQFKSEINNLRADISKQLEMIEQKFSASVNALQLRFEKLELQTHENMELQSTHINVLREEVTFLRERCDALERSNLSTDAIM